MAPSTTNNVVAVTCPVNPAGAQPVLTRSQVWSMLQHKIRSAETYVPQAIASTRVLSRTTDASTGNEVTVREVTFRERPTVLKEVCTAFPDVKVDFVLPDGSHISNIISEGLEGELYLTYVFEWRHPHMEGKELEAAKERERKMAETAVPGSVEAMRRLVRKGIDTLKA